MSSEPVFDDDAMQRYLLGQLPEEEQRRLEERFFSDDGCFEELLAIEDDLVYDYARGALGDRDRELFERRFLGVANGRERVAAARTALDAILDRSSSGTAAPTHAAPATSTAPPARVLAATAAGTGTRTNTDAATVDARTQTRASASADSSRRLGAPRGFDGSWMRWAAVLALPATVAAVWFGAQTLGLRRALDDAAGERSSLQQQLAEERTRREEASRALEAERRARQTLDERLAAAEAAARPPGSGSAPGTEGPGTVLSLMLSPGLVRGGETAARARLTPQVSTLELRLRREAVAGLPAFTVYRVSVRSADGREVWRSPVLRESPVTGAADGTVLLVRVPARLLTAGDYELTLLGLRGLRDRDRGEEVADYALSVTRP